MTIRGFFEEFHVRRQMPQQIIVLPYATILGNCNN
jgi:hypothetical protein